MVGDEVLGPLGDPGEIADAQLVRARQRGGDRQARRIGERARLLAEPRRSSRVQALAPQPLGLLEVEAQQVAAVVGIDVILTLLVTLCGAAAG